MYRLFTSLWNRFHRWLFSALSSIGQVLCSASHSKISPCFTAGMGFGVWNCHSTRGRRKTTIFTSIVHGYGWLDGTNRTRILAVQGIFFLFWCPIITVFITWDLVQSPCQRSPPGSGCIKEKVYGTSCSQFSKKTKKNKKNKPKAEVTVDAGSSLCIRSTLRWESFTEACTTVRFWGPRALSWSDCSVRCWKTETNKTIQKIYIILMFTFGLYTRVESRIRRNQCHSVVQCWKRPHTIEVKNKKKFVEMVVCRCPQVAWQFRTRILFPAVKQRLMLEYETEKMHNWLSSKS